MSDKATFLRGRSNKIDPRLWRLVDEARTKGIANASAKAWALDIPYDRSLVSISLMGVDDRYAPDALKTAVAKSGGMVTSTLGNTVFARVPIDRVPSLGDQPALYLVAPQPTIELDAMSPASGRVISEGVQRSKVSRLHQNGITGKGIRIGILDAGFQRYEELVQTGEVPPAKGQRAFGVETLENGEVHGTACAEIVHDMAPDAEVYLAAVYGDVGHTVEAVHWLVEQGVHIISHSMSHPLAPRNGQFIEGRLVDEVVTRRGVLWVNSAGNLGVGHWGGLAQDRDKNQLIDIAPGQPDGIFIRPAGKPLRIGVTWDDWGDDPQRPAATQDIDA